MIEIYNCAPISMVNILMIVVFICKWNGIHIRISEIGIHYMTFVFFTDCLKCIDVVEPYHPKRMLRQLGRVQIIPPPPLAPEKVKRWSSGDSTMCLME